MAPTEIDVAIIGAGPGGLSAALWCDELGLSSIVYESSARPGGQLLWTHNPIENYLGVKAANGSEMLELFLNYFGDRPLRLEYGRRVTSLDPDTLILTFEDGAAVSARAIVIATGVGRRDPGIDGLARFAGKGLLESGKKEAEFSRGKVAVVVGGGDAAFENAIILSEVAKRVYLIHRRDTFTARQEFISKATSDPAIEILTNSEVAGVQGEDLLESVLVRDRVSGVARSIPAGALIFRIGVTPNSVIFREFLKTDQKGYLNVDSSCRTSVEGIYAVGDVANPVAPTIATAAGMGATSAKSIISWISQSSDIE